jgi:hypothetical protein
MGEVIKLSEALGKKSRETGTGEDSSCIEINFLKGFPRSRYIAALKEAIEYVENGGLDWTESENDVTILRSEWDEFAKKFTEFKGDIFEEML